MERREMCDLGQGIEIERLVQLPIDVLDHSMHPVLVFGAAVAQRHAEPGVSS
jgi:hypothetical protein